MAKMRILGLTAPISENTAACLLEDGRLVAFAEEERFTRVKHAPRMIPINSIEYCLKQAGISLYDVDFIAIGWESVFRGWGKNIFANLKEGNFKRMIRENGAYLEYFLKMFRLKDYLSSLDETEKSWKKVRYIPHHIAHAASAARFSGFDESIIISLDGVGEDNAGLLGYFRNGKIHPIQQIGINQSLGWLYSKATEICGFTPHSHEGKLMGLGAYGNPDINLLKNIAELTDDGYILKKNWTESFEKIFKKRKKGGEITQEYKDLAASVQHFVEEAATRLVQYLYKKTKIRNIVLAGGVTLNCDMNARLLKLDCFDHIFIQPAANDAGTALGAAAEIYFQETGKKCETLTHSYYGPKYSNEEIEKILKDSKIKYRKISDLAEIARKIFEGKIVGWFSGQMEFGPRALGGRSILANPSLPGMKDKINERVKHREPWRPFAPSILKEYAADYFENYHSSPFMLLTFRTEPDKIKDIQAAVHIDGTARVQEVSKETNPKYYELISEFQKISGVPALLNTSFNDRGEPICLSPRDALKTFFSTGLDILVLENFILEK
jgi:carbamoyltransferase